MRLWHTVYNDDGLYLKVNHEFICEYREQRVVIMLSKLTPLVDQYTALWEFLTMRAEFQEVDYHSPFTPHNIQVEYDEIEKKIYIVVPSGVIEVLGNGVPMVVLKHVMDENYQPKLSDNVPEREL